jgi:hypothetical protein
MTWWIRCSVALSLLTGLLFTVLVVSHGPSRQPWPALWKLRMAVLASSLLSALIGFPVAAVADLRRRSWAGLIVAALASVAALPIVAVAFHSVFPDD